MDALPGPPKRVRFSGLALLDFEEVFDQHGDLLREHGLTREMALERRRADPASLLLEEAKSDEGSANVHAITTRSGGPEAAVAEATFVMNFLQASGADGSIGSMTGSLRDDGSVKQTLRACEMSERSGTAADYRYAHSRIEAGETIQGLVQLTAAEPPGSRDAPHGDLRDGDPAAPASLARGAAPGEPARNAERCVALCILLSSGERLVATGHDAPAPARGREDEARASAGTLAAAWPGARKSFFLAPDGHKVVRLHRALDARKRPLGFIGKISVAPCERRDACAGCECLLA
jgi:hypothetical protein